MVTAEERQPFGRGTCPPLKQFSLVEAFLAIRSLILLQFQIQQVRKTLGSLQNQNQNPKHPN